MQVLSSALSAANCWTQRGLITAQGGFFAGFSPIVWVVISLQAIGGLAIALVVKNADNLVKGFATSLSLLLSVYLSHIIFHDVVLSPMLFMGSVAVVLATFLFGHFGTNDANRRTRNNR